MNHNGYIPTTMFIDIEIWISYNFHFQEDKNSLKITNKFQLPYTHVSSPVVGLAAAAAKLLQSCPTLCDPIDGSPPGSPVPGILQARTLEWVAISFSNEWKWKVKVKSLSLVQPSATPWTAAYQAPPSMGFSRQEHWSGLSFSSPIVPLQRALNTRPGAAPVEKWCPAAVCWKLLQTNKMQKNLGMIGRKIRLELLESRVCCFFEQNLWQGLQLVVTFINYLLCARHVSKKIT